MILNERDVPNAVRLYLDQEGISQHELAERAQVSQPTVSRALTGSPKRHGPARTQLFKFIRQQTRSSSLGPRNLTAAVEEVWDGTEAHEVALASLIVASAELWPKMKGRG